MANDVVKFIGKAYVMQQAGEVQDYCVCIDSEEVVGIVLMFFAPTDEANALSAAAALNLWAGFDSDTVDANHKPMLIVRN